MSSFVVKHQSINCIVTFLQTMNNDLRFLDVNNPLGSNKDDFYAKKFGKKLHEMNVEAVTQRYADARNMMLKDKYVFKNEIASFMQILKSLHCFLYQCNEGDVPDTFLYKEMKELQQNLESAIIGALPEYQMAGWE